MQFKKVIQIWEFLEVALIKLNILMFQKQNLINLNWKPTQMVVEPKKKEELNPLEMLKKSNFDNPIKC